MSAVPTPEAHRAAPMLLVEEITHRVLNEYTFAIGTLALAANEIADSAARSALSSTARRLHAFAEAHRALQPPARPDCVDLGDQLARLCAAVTAANLQDRGVRLVLESEPVALAAQRAWRATLVVSELITNAARHGLLGGPGAIQVCLSRLGRDVLCRVSDDGGGEWTPKPSRGMPIILALAAELGGAIDWRSDARGVVAELVFPVDRLEGASAGT